MRFLIANAASLLAAGILLAPAAPAQPPAERPAEKPATPAANLPSGEELFAKHTTAIGGMDAIKAQKTLITKATFSRGGASTGSITIYRQAPDKMYKVLEILGSVTIETWCDGERAWVRNSNKGSGKLTGGNLEAAKQEASIIGESDFKASFKSLTTTEKTTFAGRPAYAVAVVAADDAKRTLYFDADTGLMVGARVPTADPERSLVLKFSEYKQYGTIKRPTVIVEELGSDRTTITYTQIDVDVTLRMSLDPPDEVRNIK